MKNSKKLYDFIVAMRDRITLQVLGGEMRAMTDKELKEINERLETQILKYIMQDKPKVAPEVVLRELQKAAPFMQRIPEAEKEERTMKRMHAARSYATAFVNATTYIPGDNNGVRERAQYRVCKCMNEEELRQYMDAYEKEKPEYYKDKNMKPEEIDAARAKSMKELHHVMAKTIMRVVDESKAMLEHNYTDEQLIDKYPDMYTTINMIQDARQGAMSSIRDYQYDDITAEQLAECDSKLVDLMANATVLEKRMATMADPYYADMTLEDLFVADSNKLNDLGESIGEHDELGADGKPISEIDGVSFSDEEILDELDAPTSADEEIKYGITMDSKENVLGLVTDAQFSKTQDLLDRMERTVGLSHEQFLDRMAICDRDGKMYSQHELMTSDSLLSEKKEFFIVSKYDDMDPVPVILDPTKEKESVIIGAGSIVDQRVETPVKPNMPGWFNRAISSIRTWVGGQPTQAMREYNKQMDEYNKINNKITKYIEFKEKLKNGQFPEKLQERTQKMKDKLAEIEESKKEASKSLASDKELLQHIPDDEEHFMQFDRVLGSILGKEAILAPKNSPLQLALYEQLKPFDNVNDINTLNSTFVNTLPFHEFSWKLRKQNPDLIRNLRSNDPQVVDQALDEIGKRFVSSFKGKTVGENSISDEYKKVVDDRKKANAEKRKVKPGQILSESQMEEAEKYYDNELIWNTAKAFYGPTRELRLDWTRASSSDIYGIENWKKMQETEVDISTLAPEGIQMDEKTFTGLSMMLGIKDPAFFRDGANIHSDVSAPDTMSFEDIVMYDVKPRDGTWRIIDNIIEPTRKRMLDCLNHMNEPVPGIEPPATGKETLAKDLTKVLKNYSERMHNCAWSERKHSVLGETCEKALEFVKAHGMEKMLFQNGLTDKEYRNVQATLAMSKIIKEGYNAEQDLIRANDNGQELSKEQRMDCMKKMMLAKAVQADIASFGAPDMSEYERRPGESKEDYLKRVDEIQKRNAEQEKSGYGGEFSDSILNLAEDGMNINDLAERMLPLAEREQLASKGIPDILKVVNMNKSNPIASKWEEKLKADPAAEQKRRDELKRKREHGGVKKFEDRLHKLGEDPRYEAVVKASEKIMKEGSKESKRLLMSMKDQQLLRCSEILQKDENIDFSKLMEATVRGTITKPKIQPQPQPEAPKVDAPKVEEQKVEAAKGGPSIG